jgi:hypothetical protein
MSLITGGYALTTNQLVDCLTQGQQLITPEGMSDLRSTLRDLGYGGAGMSMPSTYVDDVIEVANLVVQQGKAKWHVNNWLEIVTPRGRTAKVSKTYEVISIESAEAGDSEEHGFEFEDRDFTLRELVDELEEYLEVSGDLSDGSTWATTEADQDYRTGDWTRYSLHLNHGASDRQVRIWTSALRFVFGK